jgi:SPP1 gp7 family putative phage head morphogenesis protein
MTQSRLQQTINEYLKQLRRRERLAEQALEDAHANTLATIRPVLDKLYDEMVEKLATGDKIPLHWLYEAQRLESIRQLIAGRISQFAAMAMLSTGQLIRDMAQLGIRAGLALLNITVPRGVSWSFGVPSVDAIKRLVGAMQEGSPLAKLFRGFGAEAAKKVAHALITGVTLGWNPRRIAPLVQQALDISRHRALTISRNESLRAYKDAGQETYKANRDVVDKWVWHSALNGRTCVACIAMHGTEHDLDEHLNGHVNCIPAGAIVSGPRVIGSMTRWFNGQVVDIETASGCFLTVTPNHPILTPNGWVIADHLHKGCYVISSGNTKGPSFPINPDDYQVESRIEQVAATFGGSLPMFTKCMPTSPKDFHGDGGGSNIHVVRTYRHLWDGLNSTLSQPLPELQFGRGNFQFARLMGYSTLNFLFHGVFSSTHSLVRCFRVFLVLLSGSIGHHQAIGSGLPPCIDAKPFQSRTNSGTRDTIF